MDEKPIVATLVMKAAGMARQRIQVSRPRRNLDFSYQRGIGHTIEYTDLAAFHRDETALREVIGLRFNIRTVIGSVGNQDHARASLIALIADTTGHRPTKHTKLCELRTLLDLEIARLEKQGVGKEPEKPQEEEPPQPSAREVAIETRRAYLRRSGEEHVRGIVTTFGLRVKKLNNFDGMIESIIRREFPGAASAPAVTMEPKIKGQSEPVGAGKEPGFVPMKADVSNPDNPIITEGSGSSAGVELDLFAMPIDDLRVLARGRGIEAMGRNEIIDAMTAPHD